ncbi:MAG: hypothetical protein EON85_08390 [Brevundimonas sp.]|nr:MAG: hypothetical protein EON85_08390 [Brevundimonas sp.]
MPRGGSLHRDHRNRRSSVARNTVVIVGAGFGGLAAARAFKGAEVDVVLMHMKGQPRTMQDAPHYDDVVSEVVDWLAVRAGEVMAAGVAPDRLWLDPGIGFGKTPAHNMALTANLERLGATGLPVLYAASRKRTIAAIDPTATDAADRLGGSLALALEAARRGAAIIRVHDVRETVQALAVQAAVTAAISV